MSTIALADRPSLDFAPLRACELVPNWGRRPEYFCLTSGPDWSSRGMYLKVTVVQLEYRS